MPTLLLSRNTPLTQAEAARLPKGCVATDGKDGVVARAELDGPLGALLGFAVAMGRAVPDAAFVVQEGALPAPASPAAPADDEVVTETDPWKLVDARKHAEAERVFAAGNGLDADGRLRVNQMWSSQDPAVVAFGCRIARVTNWKSAVTNLRRMLSHAHPDVRKEAVTAIGALGGPSMEMAVRPLENDPDAGVREAAKAARERLK
ncbi:MAG: HEAT repeat domain-containing protein [Myxococcota bacterium]